MTAPGVALPLADDALILSHRLAEWAGHAPVLEEEVALANLALDLLGQARALYAMVGDEDALAFLRNERSFYNAQLTEQPNGDFAHTIARQLYFSTYQELLYGRLATGTDDVAALAAKAVSETAYHRDHAVTWTLRLGDGTAVSHTRMQRAADALWRYTGELFHPVVPGIDYAALHADWTARVTAVLTEATLTVPPFAPRRAGGLGREGVHTEPFGRLLAEMQHLHRSHPGASW
ncbi:1,2-phenylacetyl-CoA epoxidase subunit PaaC [Streptomyces avicenniae]|uniref:1,2-phenylacetyl-CoA epoxidase subunit PaaC n=1 Tax=Streptomyces avicenniae TaxID=500153 RepID=UPI00069C008B|nr:1,2-phenylacetyl-CoA epoxidase subunit PaaC [Streptomyces avicenniae]